MKFFINNTARTSRQKRMQEVLRDLFTIKQHIPRAHRQAQRQFDIAPVHWHLLMSLHDGKITTMGDVSKYLCITRGAATQIIDTLVDKGLIDRRTDSKDRRIVRLTLTHKSHKLSQEFHQYVTDSFDEFFAALSDEELAVYAKLTHKISNNIKGDVD